MNTNLSPNEAIVSEPGNNNSRTMVAASSKAYDYFVIFLVVIAAMALGGLTAFLIGLFTGWIPFIVC